MKNKGFTLVELLAVIIVLAVIATITYPAMTDLIAKAQIRGARTRAISWVDSVDKSMVNNEFTYDYNYLTPGIYDLPLDEKYKIDVKGTKPTGGWIEVGEDGIERYSIVIDDKYVVTNMGDEITVKKGTDTERSIFNSYIYLLDLNGSKQVGDTIAGDINVGDKYIYTYTSSENNLGISASVVTDSEEECNHLKEIMPSLLTVGLAEDKINPDYTQTCTLKKDYVISKNTYTSEPDKKIDYFKYLVDENGIIKSMDICSYHGKDKEYCVGGFSSYEYSNKAVTDLVNDFHGKMNVKDSNHRSFDVFMTNDNMCGTAKITNSEDISDAETIMCESDKLGMVSLAKTKDGFANLMMNYSAYSYFGKARLLYILHDNKYNKTYTFTFTGGGE